MDRYETVVKAEEVIKYAQMKNYGKACEVLDTINTSKMKNYDDLIIFAEVYMRNKRYIEAKEILVRLHNKSTTRRVVALLINVTSKMHNYVEAEQYYEEYTQIAPRDVNRFILRYKIDKAKGLNYDVLINSLEQLKEYDLIEEWEYELAKLYHKAGYEDKCISECNTIIMMFGEGTIVEKAKLLRDHHIDTLSVGAGGKNTDEDGSKYEFNATKQLDKIIDQVKEKLEGENQQKDELPQGDKYDEDVIFASKTEEKYEEDNDKIGDEFFEKEKVTDGQGMQAQEQQPSQEQPSLNQNDNDSHEPGIKHMQPKIVPEPEEKADNGFDIDRFTKAARQMTRAARMGIDDIINNADVLFIPNDPERVAVKTPQTPDTVAAPAVSTVPIVSKTVEVVPHTPSQAVPPTPVMQQTEQVAKPEIPEDEEDYGDGCRQLNLLDGFLDGDYEKTVGVKKKKEEPVKEIIKVPEVEEDYFQDKPDDDELDDAFLDNISNMLSSHVDKILDEAVKEANESQKDDKLSDEVSNESKSVQQKESKEDETIESEEISQEVQTEQEVQTKQEDNTHVSEGEELSDEEYNKIMQNLAILLTPESYNDISTEDISKDVFRNYYLIPSIRMNIRCSLANLKKNVVRGNFIICGDAKTGRTTLAKMIAKTAYDRDLIDTNKIARIDGEKFNNVDLEHKQEKLADGCLIIQNAHKITPAAMTSLITMIVHLAGRIIVFLETDYDNIASLYLKTNEVREYFTSVVTTPEYTQKELVGFAKSYAAFKGFSFNESGLFAINELIESVYDKIEKDQRIPFILTSVEKAIRASLSRNNAGFGKPNSDGLNVLEMQDVEQQYI